jgi:hypothetical protein
MRFSPCIDIARRRHAWSGAKKGSWTLVSKIGARDLSQRGRRAAALN